MSTKRRTRDEIEREWFDAFARWNRADRAAALKVLRVLHDQLPDAPRARDAAADGNGSTNITNTLELKEPAANG